MQGQDRQFVGFPKPLCPWPNRWGCEDLMSEVAILRWLLPCARQMVWAQTLGAGNAHNGLIL